MRKGNIIVSVLIVVVVILVGFLFILGLIMSNVNSLIYSLKLNMYAINRSGIISVNKYKTSIDDFSYDEKSYRKYFIEALKKEYDLDENMHNKDKLIEKIDIKEYEILKKGKIDTYTGNKTEDITLHTVVNVKIRPTISNDLLESFFEFEVHEDVKLNMIKMYN